MSYSIINKDIVEINADAIINASNGVGFMGGLIGKYIRCKGVAESLHYATKGAIEKEAKKECKSNNYNPGDIFITNAANLNADYIIHAVTMKRPGTSSNIDVIKALLPKIIKKAYELNLKSIAIPLLGTGVGKVNKNDVMNLYKDYFSDIKDLDILIIVK